MHIHLSDLGCEKVNVKCFILSVSMSSSEQLNLCSSAVRAKAQHFGKCLLAKQTHSLLRRSIPMCSLRSGFGMCLVKLRTCNVIRMWSKKLLPVFCPKFPLTVQQFYKGFISLIWLANKLRHRDFAIATFQNQFSKNMCKFLQASQITTSTCYQTCLDSIRKDDYTCLSNCTKLDSSLMSGWVKP